MASFHLSIITPTGTIFSDQVESVMAPGSQGAFGVLKNHAPMITILDSGILRAKQSNKDFYFAVMMGSLEVDQSGDVLVLSGAATKFDTLETAKQNTTHLQGIFNS